MIIYAKVDGVPFQFSRPETDSRGFHIGSWAKYCPYCLEGWAHFSAVHDGQMKGYHAVGGQMCADCAYTRAPWFHRYVPGSLLEEPAMNFQTLDWDLLLYLPRELLLREFRLHDQFFTRQDHSNGNTAKPSKPAHLTSSVEWYLPANPSNVRQE